MVWWCDLPIRGVQWSDVSIATVLVWPTSSHVHVASRTPYSNLTHEQSQLAHQQDASMCQERRTLRSISVRSQAEGGLLRSADSSRPWEGGTGKERAPTPLTSMRGR